jgi:hypothetical protein
MTGGFSGINRKERAAACARDLAEQLAHWPAQERATTMCGVTMTATC